MIDVEWYKEDNTSYNVDIEIYSNDRNGLLVDILKVINMSKAKLTGVNTRITKEKIAIIDMGIEVENLVELNKLMKDIRKVDSVYEVRRKK
jgi:GTP pyrophosphokinase